MNAPAAISTVKHPIENDRGGVMRTR